MHLKGVSLVKFGISPAPFAILLGLIFWISLLLEIDVKRTVPPVALPIYLIHQFGICLAGIIMRNYYKAQTFGACITNFALVVTATLVIFAVVRKFKPVWRILSGGRE